MTNVLSEICDVKRALVADRRAETSIDAIEKKARSNPPTRGFVKALQRSMDAGNYALIAEIKKASPSKGLIREDFSPALLAQAYQRGGASCLSVLTDTPYFQGADEYLVEARDAVDLPVLRKDFMIDSYQIVESRALGAACILLIMAALSDAQAQELESAAIENGLDVLVEVHDRDELDRALHLQSPLIGVNNRNLKDLSVDIARSEDMLAHFPPDRIAVSESGLYTTADLERMERAGARCFLIGESLMRQEDVEAATRALLAAA